MSASSLAATIYLVPHSLLPSFFPFRSISSLSLHSPHLRSGIRGITLLHNTLFCPRPFVHLRIYSSRSFPHNRDPSFQQCPFSNIRRHESRPTPLRHRRHALSYCRRGPHTAQERLFYRGFRFHLRSAHRSSAVQIPSSQARHPSGWGLPSASSRTFCQSTILRKLWLQLLRCVCCLEGMAGYAGPDHLHAE